MIIQVFHGLSSSNGLISGASLQVAAGTDSKIFRVGKDEGPTDSFGHDIFQLTTYPQVYKIMADTKGPSLEQLGLDEPTNFSQGKISIESLQRQSEVEMASARLSPSPVPIEPRNAAMDLMAGILSFIVPGAGHLLKGHVISGVGWFMMIIVLYSISLLAMALFFILGLPFLMATFAIHVFCIAKAIAL